MRRAEILALAFLAAGLLGGCAASPAQVREANLPTVVASSNPPFTAINCIARRSEEGRSGLVASIRETAAGGRYETAIRNLDNTVAVIEAAPAASGSTLTVWQHPETLDAAAASLMANVKAC